MEGRQEPPPSVPEPSGGDAPPPQTHGAEAKAEAGTKGRRWLRPENRRRIALLVLVVGGAALVAYWSRGRPVDVEVVYDFGRHSKRVVRVELAYDHEKKGVQSVEMDFPSAQGAPKRWRHTLRLTPGEHTVRATVHLRAADGKEAEVKRYSRRVVVRSGEEQRLVLRFAR